MKTILKKPTFLLAAGLLFFYGNAQTKIIVDIGKPKQTMVGFGASDAWDFQYLGKNWPLEKRNQVADWLFSKEVDKNGNPKGIGLSMWRFYIGAGSTEQGDSSYITDPWRRAECFQNPDGTYDWNKHQGQQWFLEAAKKRGVEKLLAFTIAPPVHMSQNNRAFSGQKARLNIQPGKVDDYAGFLADVLQHFQQKGFSFDYISPVNEPCWDWLPNNKGWASQEGTPLLNSEITAFTKALNKALVQRKLATRIAVGEAGDLRVLNGAYNKLQGRDDQINYFWNPSSEGYIGKLSHVLPVITGHSYFTTGDLDTLINVRRNLTRQLQEVAPNVGFWQTEYCILEKGLELPEGGRGRDTGMNTALYVARVIHADLTLANAQSWQWWLAVSNYNFKDGLIYLDRGNNGINGAKDPDADSLQYDGFVRDSKLLWALGNYARFVRPGMQRVEVRLPQTSAEPLPSEQELMVSAFINRKEKQLVMVAVNPSKEPKPLQVENLGRSLKIKQPHFDTYTTSATQKLQKGKMPAQQVVIPAQSVVTLTAILQ